MADKRRMTVIIPYEEQERLRNAVSFLAGPPEWLNVSKVVRKSVNAELDRLETKYNKGKPFPKRPQEIRGGRPEK